MSGAERQQFAQIENLAPIAEELFWMVVLSCPKKGVILELGSGLTTALFKGHRKIYSVEDNPEWLGKNNAPEYSIFAPRENEFYSRKVLACLPRYDVLFVDGPCDDSRMDRFAECVHFFNPVAHWFFDDTAFPAFQEGLQRIQDMRQKSLIRFDKNFKQFGLIMAD